MFGDSKSGETQIIGFLLIPDFSMIAFTSAIEPLRAANRIARKSLYNWILIGPGSGGKSDIVEASNGVRIQPDYGIDEIPTLDALVVCAGLKVTGYSNSKLIGRLRHMARRRVMIGAVCTGSVLLARAGLLKDRRCTIHWENIEGFAETYPDLDIMSTLFEVDRNRFTCSGGTAPLDMMIHSISLDHGQDLAMNVAEQLLHTALREPHDTQRMNIGYRTGLHNPKLLAAIGYMEVHLENPMTLSGLADSVGLSLRQLERLFKTKLQTTPARYYLNLRLQRARQLLRQTPMSMLQVAVSTGFSTASHFTRSYKTRFGHPPTTERN